MKPTAHFLRLAVISMGLVSLACIAALLSERAGQQSYANLPINPQVEKISSSSPSPSTTIVAKQIHPDDEQSITIQDLVEAVTEPHEVSPLPSVPSNWRFAKYPIPSTKAETHRLDHPLGKKFKRYNPWNHIDSVRGITPDNVMVEMGDLHFAAYIEGEWHEQNFGPPCTAAEHPFGNPSRRFGNRGLCQDGSAFAGIGFNNWTNPKHHIHGWSPTPHFDHSSGKIEYVIAWGTARAVPQDPSKPADLNGDHYQYRVGADKRNPSQKGVLPAITHGRARIVRPTWRFYIATTMSPNTLKQLCQQGKLPPSLPFSGGC
ncbi:hypothetical protein C1752_00900 [Acaryochloris thomasi RCC1774]|uniref:Uncharacterized protein n=1 Tax=Acaryochloris thomasi RCC1774 TaxID=1764569 RepID=A0A2W1JN50_9CYAN|nr:hypothetical protein [Acaryochloris thomasi]PZD74646.1 hypothetical protein C1752_00900 [Acaryochloris thomasi RCC1774]